MKRVLRVVVLVSLLSLSVVTVSSCAKVAASPSLRQITAGGATLVNVDVNSYIITPNTLAVPAGKVTFHVSNRDAIVHEMLVVHAQSKSFDLPYDLSISRVVENQINKPGEVPNIEPNISGDVTLDLPPGRYVLLCNLVGHFQAGMHTLIDVLPSDN